MTSRAQLFVVGAVLLLGLCELPVASFMADDFIQLGVLEGVSPDTWTGPLELHTIADGVPEHVQIMKEQGAFAWFFDPLFKMAFFRPLSSALLAIDHSLWGLEPVGYRAHGLLWFWLLVIAAGAILCQVLPGRLATLSFAVFALSGVHANLYWTATRHIAVAAAIGALALLAHLRWREQGWRPGRPLSVLACAISLTASEAAMAVIAYLIAYELLGAEGELKTRLKALAPIAGVVLVYLVMYQALGLGVSSGSGYVDPVRDPLAFVSQFPARWLVLGAGMLFGGHVDLWVLRPDLHGAMIVAGVVAAALALLLLRAVWPHTPDSARRSARWLMTGALLAAVPFSGSAIGSRCLIVPMIGGAVAIAVVIEGWWSGLRKIPRLGARLVGALCALLALIHLVVAPLQRLAGPSMFRAMMNEKLARAMEEVDRELELERLPHQRVVVLMAPDIAIGLHAYFYRRLYRMPMPRSWRTLSWTHFDHRIHRSAVGTFELELVDGELKSPHLRVQQVVALEGMSAEVLEMGEGGPTRVAFTFDRSLDDPDLVFLAWREGRLQRVVMPAPGESLLLRR